MHLIVSHPPGYCTRLDYTHFVCKVDRGKLTRFEVGKSEYQWCMFNASAVPNSDEIQIHLAALSQLGCQVRRTAGDTFEVYETK